MALKKNNTNTVADTAPAFEESGGAPWNEGDSVAEAETVTETVTQAAPAAAQAAATTAIATSAVSVAAEKAREFKEELESMRGATSAEYGILPSYKADNGAIAETGNGKTTFGKWMAGRMMSFDTFHQVSPGDSGAKTKGFVAFSKDGVTVDSVIGDGTERSFVGKPVQAYLDYLRDTEGLTDAQSKEYLTVTMVVLDSEAKTVEPGTQVNVVLSQSSIRSFRAYEEKLKLNARAAAMGLPVKGGVSEDPFRFKFVAENASNNRGQKWCKLAIEPIA